MSENKIINPTLLNIKIGYLFPDLTGIAIRHLRNIFMTEELNIKIIINSNNKKLIDNNFYFKINNISIDKIIFYNNNNLLDILNNFNVILHCKNPDITQTFNDTYNFNEKILNKLKPQIFYIHHGLSSIYDLNSWYINNNELFISWKNTVNSMNKYNLNFISACKHLYNMLDFLNFNNKNLYKINSLPQFDLNLKLKNYINEYKNSIVIIVGENENININNIIGIIKIIRNNYKDIEIIIKFKFYDKIGLIIKNKFNNIKCFYEEKYLFEFINSFLIIVTSGGTSFFEILMYNNKVILYIPPNTLKYYNAYPFKINKLGIVNDLNSLNNKIKTFENDSYFDKEYDTEKEIIKDFHVNKDLNNFYEDLKNILLKL
jgi:hypothetical protein